ncbi:hypothetical protein HYX17_00495 [Candidatus Woesearchaeota archaeon]|nr:hypothetical protein [Candidatus Woesearchaeota archaeon]
MESGYFVGIDYEDRHSVTVSTQQGCSWTKVSKQCTFCETGQQDYLGQLSGEQIVQQGLVMALDNGTPEKTGQLEVAFMGMGEPAANYNEVARSIEGFEVILPNFKMNSIRYIFSTSGVPQKIIQLGKDLYEGRFGNAKIRLHVSLHAHTDEQRNEIVPINKNFPIADLMSSIREYSRYVDMVENADKLVSINYMLFNNYKSRPGVSFTNITPQSIEELANLLNDPLHFRPVLCEFNECSTPNDSVSFSQAEELKRILEKKGYKTKIFGSFGHSANLACGQLVGTIDENCRDQKIVDYNILKNVEESVLEEMCQIK